MYIFMLAFVFGTWEWERVDEFLCYILLYYSLVFEYYAQNKKQAKKESTAHIHMILA